MILSRATYPGDPSYRGVRTWQDPRGMTPHINRQGGQDLKKNITPKKYLRSAKNTNLPPKNTPSPPVGLSGESTPWWQDMGEWLISVG